MVTLEKLAQDLNINQFDEVVGGKAAAWTFIWDVTTNGGTSGEGGATWTTEGN